MRLPSKRAFWEEALAVMEGESYPDIKNEAIQKRLAEAHRDLNLQYLNKEFPHVLGKRVYFSSEGTYVDHNPYHGAKMPLGRFQRFDARSWDMDKAFDDIARAQDIWRATPWKKRALYLYALAHKLMSDEWTWRFVSALMHDTGKSFLEAWGEYNEVYRFVLEHIWFMFRRYDPADTFPSSKLAGDYFGSSSRGKGIGIVIAPFNFPAAIPIRMVTLMLACGCVSILKGATTASLVSQLIFDVCEEVRIETGIGPMGLVSFAPGSGGVAADAFLSRPEIRVYSFTGSPEVCEGVQRKYHFSDRIGGNQLITGSAETGGVNWVVLGNYEKLRYVAVQGVKANFGISGQKCSTMRLFFCPDVLHLTMLTLFIEEYDKLKYGDVLTGADLGPVIDANAKRDIDEKIAMLEAKGIVHVAYRKKIDPSPSGNDVPPTILLATVATLWEPDKMNILLNTEIFGPVFTIVPYVDLSEVKALTSLTKFGLTGAAFERDPKLLANIQHWLPAGNSYGNRRCTGATAPEPFGGLGGSMSSYNSGLKGYYEMALYFDDKTHSTVYPEDWTDVERKIYVSEMNKHGTTVKL
jgi:acyl-CoA reductase-like NAD-dependent aldehyde dehydrogenase